MELSFAPVVGRGLVSGYSVPPHASEDAESDTAATYAMAGCALMGQIVCLSTSGSCSAGVAVAEPAPS